MKEFVLKALFDNKKASSNCSQGSSISIVTEHYEEALMFDGNHYEKH
ncbi:982_t:CDS:1, partial [Gigaspora margarita]